MPPVRFHIPWRQGLRFSRARAGPVRAYSVSTRTSQAAPRTLERFYEPDAAWPPHAGSRPIDVEAQSKNTAHSVSIDVKGAPRVFHSLLLRDFCTCPRCVDPSTRQKHFSTADIPGDIEATVVANDNGTVSLAWSSDIPGYEDHVTELSVDTLKQLHEFGAISLDPKPTARVFWDENEYKRLADFDYQSYMSDDQVLLTALRQLHTHGLLFVTGVPGNEESVSNVAERIGPLKTTFYGKTWDVRSVPEAKNVAYTAQNLGFHMDLMYMKQPPHLQLLHCIRSSALGGASLFTDSFRAVRDLSEQDIDAYETLSRAQVNFHYDHPGSQYYHQTRTVIEERPVHLGQRSHPSYSWLSRYRAREGGSPRDMLHLGLESWLEAVSWAPPFQGPFALRDPSTAPMGKSSGADKLGRRLVSWHEAAQKFNALVEQPQGIFERLMKPGECVIFDNRRVLHARKAFEVGDAGSERWLRGAYIDKDPYDSKLRVLTELLQNAAQ